MSANRKLPKAVKNLTRIWAEKKLEKKAPVDQAPAIQNVAQASEVRGI